MADLFDNPAGLDGFEFIEFSAPEKDVLEPVFETMGFTKIARHRSKDVELWLDRYDNGSGGLSVYDIDFEYLEGVDKHPVGCGFELIDHLTHNVYGGRMAYWAKYYETLFNFQEIRFFDIKGEYTGLTSRALTAPDGKIRIPLNEEGLKSSCASLTARVFSTLPLFVRTSLPVGIS